MVEYAKKPAIAETETETKEVEQPVKKEYPKQFVMIKNYPGALSVKLDTYDYSSPTRWVRFRWDQEQQNIPAKWAIGVFTTSSALRQLEQGYFTFSNLQVLIEMAEEQGFFVPDSIKEPVITLKELRSVLLKNDVNEIKKVMMNASNKNITDLIAVARMTSVLPRLTMAVTDYIEKTYKVQLNTVSVD